MTAQPTRWGTDDTQVDLVEDFNYPISVKDSTIVLSPAEARQLAVNLIAAAYEYDRITKEATR